MPHFGPTRRPGTSLAVVAVVVAAAFGGCGGGDNGGGGDDQPLTAREIAHAFVAAQNAGDFARVCELFGDPLRQHLGGDNCVNFLVLEPCFGREAAAPLEPRPLKKCKKAKKLPVQPPVERVCHQDL